jgi:hypothetical protein
MFCTFTLALIIIIIIIIIIITELLILILLILRRNNPTQEWAASLLMFLDHAHTHIHPVGLLWTNDQLFAEAASYITHTHTDTTDEHPCPQRDSNPRSEQSTGCRLSPQAARIVSLHTPRTLNFFYVLNNCSPNPLVSPSVHTWTIKFWLLLLLFTFLKRQAMCVQT